MRYRFRWMKLGYCGQSGISLVELLVAMAVGLILLAGVYQIFIGNTTSYSLNEDMSRLQENGRFAIQLLNREVQGAGFLGCLQDVSSFSSTLNDSDDFAYSFSNAIYGLEASGSTWSDDDGSVTPETAISDGGMGLTDPVKGSDILVLRGVQSEQTIVVTKNMNDVNAALQVTENLGKTKNGPLDEDGGDILLVSDCEAAVVFQTNSYTNANGNLVHNEGDPKIEPGNATKSFGHMFGPGAEVFFAQTVTYYIRDNATTGQPCLYRKVNQEDVEELVEGVENMQVVYGEDTDNDHRANKYVTAAGVSDWQDVVSVRIGLVMRTVDPILRGQLDTSTYDVDGDGVAEYDPADDRRMRLIVRSTMGLRNRLR